MNKQVDSIVQNGQGEECYHQQRRYEGTWQLNAGEQPWQHQGLLLGGARSRKILGRLRGESSSLGLEKKTGRGGSVGSHSAMKSQTQGKYL